MEDGIIKQFTIVDERISSGLRRRLSNGEQMQFGLRRFDLS